MSLIEEQIPRYVLRADTLTDFAGYENEDWIRTPVLPPEQDLPLSPELIDETLKYFGEYMVLLVFRRKDLCEAKHDVVCWKFCSKTVVKSVEISQA